MFHLLATNRLLVASVVGIACLILEHNARQSEKHLYGEHPILAHSPSVPLADSSGVR